LAKPILIILWSLCVSLAFLVQPGLAAEQPQRPFGIAVEQWSRSFDAIAREIEQGEIAQGRALVDNPVCGDQVRVEIVLAEGRIAEVAAIARGCSIAVASGSVMTERVRGLDRAAASALGTALDDLVHGRPVPPDLAPELRAFARVVDLPSRRRCALLAWEALDQAIGEALAAASAPPESVDR